MAAGSEGGLQEVSLDAGGMQRAAWRCVRLGRSLGKTYRAGFGTIVATRAHARACILIQSIQVARSCNWPLDENSYRHYLLQALAGR